MALFLYIFNRFTKEPDSERWKKGHVKLISSYSNPEEYFTHGGVIINDDKVELKVNPALRYILPAAKVSFLIGIVLLFINHRMDIYLLFLGVKNFFNEEVFAGTSAFFDMFYLQDLLLSSVRKNTTRKEIAMVEINGLLPIGSVVSLIENDKKVMVIGVCQRKAHESEKVFDYSGVISQKGS
ncbi:MAG: DUF4176 domain-containing protein [Eggerthellaceae bacterium]|nr:DUF4176 domain-containing protein [Eggerthellaceae bacterium]